MHTRPSTALLVAGCALALIAPALLADDFTIDSQHASVAFRIKHLDLSYVHGLFTDVQGTVTLDANAPEKTSFQITVSAESITTGNKKRDDHLRGPDFFNARQFPNITFKSTGAKATTGSFEVTGDLTLHGVTKIITVTIKKLGEGKDPWGGYRAGFATQFTIKRTDFGMDKMVGPVGDEVELMVSFEALRK